MARSALYQAGVPDVPGQRERRALRRWGSAALQGRAPPAGRPNGAGARTCSAAWPSVVLSPGSAYSYGTAQRLAENSLAISACTAYASGSSQVAHRQPAGMSAAARARAPPSGYFRFRRGGRERRVRRHARPGPPAGQRDRLRAQTWAQRCHMLATLGAAARLMEGTIRDAVKRAAGYQ